MVTGLNVPFVLCFRPFAGAPPALAGYSPTVAKDNRPLFCGKQPGGAGGVNGKPERRTRRPATAGRRSKRRAKPKPQGEPGRNERGRTGGRERSERGRPRTTATKPPERGGKGCRGWECRRAASGRAHARPEAARRQADPRGGEAPDTSTPKAVCEWPSRHRKRAAHRERTAEAGGFAPKAASEDEADKAKASRLP